MAHKVAPDRQLAAGVANGHVTEILPPVGQVSVVTVLSPIRAADGTLRCSRTTAPAEQPLSTYVPDGMPVERLIRSGTVVPPEAWPIAVAQDGDEITLMPKLGAYGSLTAIIIGAVISIAIGLAVQAITYLLFPPQQTKIQDLREDPVFGWEGIRTARGPGGEVALTYGRHRIGGQLLSADIELQRAAVDSGTVAVTRAITNIVGGDPPGVTEPDATPITVVSANHGIAPLSQVVIAGVTGKLNVNGTWVVSGTNVSANTFLLAQSEGIDGRAYTGGGTATTFAQVRAQAVEQSPTLNMLIALGEGPLSNIDLSTVELNGQPIGNFPGVQFETRLGTPDQTAISWATETRNSFSTPPAGGTEIGGGGGLTYTTTAAVTSFIIGLEFRDGLCHMNDKGEKEENWTEWRYRYRVSPSGAWSDYTTLTVHGNKLSRVFFATRRDGLASAIYDINVEWVASRATDAARSRWKPYLGTITEVQAGTRTYPNTALLALRAIATEQLQGAIPNVSVVVDGLLVRQGSFNAPRTYSTNAAWCILDVLTHPRYGLGFPDGTINLPAWAVAANYCNEQIHGETRHVFNWVLTREQRAQDVILEMAAAARLVLIRSEGQWVLRPTFNGVAVQLLSWASCTNVKLHYTKDPDRINVIEGRFQDEQQNWETNVLTWPPIDQWPAQPRKTSLELRGITSRSRVNRALQYELNRRRLPRITLEMECALDALRLQAHDLFMFSHPLPGWGVSGRTVTGTTTVLTVDEDVTFQAGNFYHIYIRHDDDLIELKPLNNPGNVTTRTLNIQGGFALAKAPTPRISHWAVGKSTPVNTAVRIFRVATMERTQDQRVLIQAVQHHPGIYDEVQASPPPVITTLFNPLGPPPPLIHLAAVELVRIDGHGISRKVAHLSWNVAALSRGFAPYGGAIIFRRNIRFASGAGTAMAGTVGLGSLVSSSDPGGDYTRIADVGASVYEYDDGTVITGGIYEYRIVPISGRGVPNNQGAGVVQIGIGGGTTPDFYPPAPLNLRLKDRPVGHTTFDDLDAHFVWDAPANTGVFGDTSFVSHYRVEIWAPGSAYVMRGGILTTDTQFVYTYAMNSEDNTRAGQHGPRRDFLIKVWSWTTAGRESLLAAELTVSNAAPDMSSVFPDLVPLIEGMLVEWGHYVDPRDITRYEVRFDPFTPPITVVGSLQSVFGTTTKQWIIPKLAAGTTYYAQILPYDAFGAGIPSGIASAAPLSPAEAWNFFVRDFMPEGIAFSANPDTNTVSWTAGTLNYVDDRGTLQSRPIAAGSAVWTSVTAFIFYTLGDTSFQVSAGIVGALGPDKAVMAVYNGGTALIVNFGKVLVHGSDLVANSIGANQLVTSTAVITVAAQIANAIISSAHIGTAQITSAHIAAAQILAAHIANAQITDAHIASLTADKIVAGAIKVLISLGVGNQFLINGFTQQLAIIDQSGFTRVLMGKVGTGPQDWGLQIRNASNQLIYDLTGLGIDTVNTSNVINGAITNSASAETAGSIGGGASEISVQSVAISTVGGSCYLFAQVTLANTSIEQDHLIARIHKDSAGGALLATVTTPTDSNGSATIIARDTAPASTQTYHLTVQGSDAASTWTATDRRLLVMNARR